ncbi:MAG TPA: hypothetical protein DCW65_13000 [Klebsiella pneumoniae]|nr:hypothetical protein [Klebsiella pneumoniae]
MVDQVKVAAVEQEPTEQSLRRNLTNRHIQLIAIGGAIGTGLFMGSGKTISLAGPSIIFVYMIIGFMLFFVMRAMGELLLSNLEYKSFSDFAADLLGPWAGYFTGWTYWFCWVVTGMADVVAITAYAQFWFPGLSDWVASLAVIGLLERHGLKERAQAWIAKIHSATAGRLLIVYLFVREATAALGLTSLGGHPQMVRPLLAPMAEGAAEKRFGPLPGNVRYRLRAMSAATDNVGLFFGEDIFVAFGAIIFMHNFMLESGGIQTEPLHIALWGIPTAICAFLIHAARLWRLDRHLQRELDRINVGQAKGGAA